MLAVKDLTGLRFLPREDQRATIVNRAARSSDARQGLGHSSPQHTGSCRHHDRNYQLGRFSQSHPVVDVHVCPPFAEWKLGMEVFGNARKVFGENHDRDL